MPKQTSSTSKIIIITYRKRRIAANQEYIFLFLRLSWKRNIEISIVKRTFIMQDKATNGLVDRLNEKKNISSSNNFIFRIEWTDACYRGRELKREKVDVLLLAQPLSCYSICIVE